MRMRWLLGLAAAAPLVLYGAGPALGQEGIGGGIGAYGEHSETGTVHGVVQRLSFPRGLLEVSTARGTIAVHGTPDQLSDYRIGDRVDVDYDDYAGIRWISGGGGGMGIGGYGEGSYAVQGRAAGVVSHVNAARGTMTIGGAEGPRIFHAHPDDLQDVIPGQFVSLDYAKVGGARWVEDVSPGGP